jgi:hypothetical protein
MPQEKDSAEVSASAIGVPCTSLHRMKVDKNDSVIVPHSNAIKPAPNEPHKFARVLCALSNLNLDAEEHHDFYDLVHVDEKWLFLTEVQLRVCLAPGETPPTRSTRHKSHMTKVMFLCTVARPRCNAAGACTFDGKTGPWPFVETAVAIRDSVHCPAGTEETKQVNVTAEIYKQHLIEKVVPAIKAKWPDRNREITIQQDGASSHVEEADEAFVEAATTGNWTIKLVTQPAQSLDTNHLDLSFFRALQSAQWDHGFALEIDGLIAQVRRAHAEFPSRKIDFGFLTSQSCPEEIILSQGDNDYKIPHIMGKEGLLREGALPVRIAASAQACMVAREVLGEFDGEFDGGGDANDACD